MEWRKEDLKKRLEKSRRLVSGEEEVDLKPTGEEGILLIKALCGLGRAVSNVNIPNTFGQIGNLPKTALVETNALFEKDAVRPVAAGTLPEKVKALIMPHIQNHERILEAALTCRKDLVIDAFLEDPLVKGKNCSRKDAEELVEDMIAATMAYLPEGWRS